MSMDFVIEKIVFQVWIVKSVYKEKSSTSDSYPYIWSIWASIIPYKISNADGKKE